MSRLIRRLLLLLLLPVYPGGLLYGQVTNFNATVVSGCSPLQVQFISSAPGGSTYFWNLGNGGTSTLANPQTYYTGPGSYTVTLITSGPGGNDTVIKTGFITVHDTPLVSFIASNLAGCTPHSTQFTSSVVPNVAGLVTYAWNFGDGTVDTAASPYHTYNYPGVYTVSLKVTNAAGCSTTVAQNAYITAYAVPVAAFSTSPLFYCSANIPITFNNTSSGGKPPLTYAWSYGDGGTGSTPTHTYTTGGVFTVSLTVTDSNSCSKQLVKPGYITVNDSTPSFNMVGNGCKGSTVYMTNTTAGATNTTWNFGDGGVDTAENSSHIYTSAGTYSVTMRTTFLGCTKTKTLSVTIHPKPVATISMNPSAPCPAPTNVTFTGSSALAAVYAWSWQSGGADTGLMVTKHYASVPFPPLVPDKVTLITTSAMGCKDTVSIDTVYIRDIIMDIQPSRNYPLGPGAIYIGECIGRPIPFQEVLYTNMPIVVPLMPIPYPFPETSWFWDFGDGTTSTLSKPQHAYANAGNYMLKCIVTTSNNCSDTGYAPVHIDTVVHPSFTTLSPLTICPKTTVTIINTTDSIIVGTLFAWGIQNDQYPLIGKEWGYLYPDSITYSFPSSGTYTVKLLSYNKGCIDSSYSTAYISVSLPLAEFVDSNYCSPSRTTVKFTNKSKGLTSQLWDFGDGNTDTSFSPVHTYATAGIYTIRLVVYNSSNGCTDTFKVNDTLFTPVFDFAASDSAVCRGQFVQFWGIYTGPIAVRYAWRIDVSLSLFDSLTYHDYYFNGTTGYKDITLFVNSGGNCVDSIRKNAFILVAQPEVKFGALPPIGCEPLPVLFIDSTTNAPGVNPAVRYWRFGDGDSTYNNVSSFIHIYNDTGTYSVWLKVTDSLGCMGQLFKQDYIRVHRAYAEFTVGADSGCIDQPIVFTSTSTSTTSGLRHYWSFGDGTTDTGYYPVHRYATAGYYTVRLIVIDSAGCTDTMLVPNSINIVKPHAQFFMSDSVSVCPQLTVNFRDSSTGGIVYRSWDFGAGGAISHVTNPITPYSGAGLYNVSLVVTNSTGCTDTARATVRILGYSGAFTYSPLEGCIPMTVQFNASLTNISQVKWDFLDGVIDTTATTSTTHIYTSRGKYVPKVIFSDGKGCFASSVGLDTIRVDELIADFHWTVPCMDAPFTLRDSSSGFYRNPSGWYWMMGGDTASGTPTNYTFNTSGNHPVTLIVSNAIGCKDTITKNVFVNPLPIVDAGENQGICPGDSTIFVARGAQSYTWTPASLINCLTGTCDSIRVWTAAPTMYYVSGTDSNKCVGKDSVKAFIQIKTETHVGTGGEICLGESFQLSATGATSYSWTPAASLSNAHVSDPIATPQFTTIYVLEAQKTTCLISYDTIKVVVHPLPVFDAGFDETINLGESVVLHPTRSGIDHIIWKSDTTLSCTDCFDPRAKPYYTKIYYATGYDAFGCSASDSVKVFVRCNGSMVFIPNTFTPNGDGQNDYFFPRGEGVGTMGSLKIFNRWGQMVYERNNIALNDEHAGWDGTYKGQALAPDVYMYTMQARCEDGKMVTWKGDVTLVK